MKKTGAWLVRYALEELGITYTFGIPGVHNTEIYDELNLSKTITPILVTHEACASFMADAISRTSDKTGTLVIVPAAGAAYASAGIGEAFLDGIPMIVISGGVRTDGKYAFQLHEMNQQNFLAEITKKTFKINEHKDIVPAIFEAYRIAHDGEPGPVFVEVPVNLQLYAGEIENLSPYDSKDKKSGFDPDDALIDQAVELIMSAKNPGIFAGWGARDATDNLVRIAEYLNAPVCTTLQGLSVFPGNHPLHTGMGFGGYAVPAASNAFKNCDCMLAIGTRFGEIATGSFGVAVPENLIHIDINPSVFNVNYPARVIIKGDALNMLHAVLQKLQQKQNPQNHRTHIRDQIKKDKQSYKKEWLAHNSGTRVNPAVFFEKLRNSLKDDDFVVADDGNHTFLAAELMPIHASRRFISPTDFNCMGYAVPAVIGTKLAHPENQVVGIIGDGAFTMTCMEILTATSLKTGAVFFVFKDGELSQIAQAQELPYNRKVCTVLGNLSIKGVAMATGAQFLMMKRNEDAETVITKALQLAAGHTPVIVEVNIDYKKHTRFTKGILKTNLNRFNLGTKARFIGRAMVRHITG
ncbi:MAG: thiamine pyrophosphate-binding protein [Proteobacteria bacterium]|nr:thiamine pyrophosphate-binding protein [Pseudomonadota bacterium]